MEKLSRDEFRSRLPEIRRQAEDNPEEPIMWMRVPGDDGAWRSLVLVPGWDKAVEVDERDLDWLHAEEYIRFERGTRNGGAIYVTAEGRAAK